MATALLQVTIPLPDIDRTRGQFVGTFANELFCTVHRRDRKRPILLVDIKDCLVGKHVLFLNAVVKHAILSYIIEDVADFIQAFAYHVSSPSCLDLDDDHNHFAQLASASITLSQLLEVLSSRIRHVHRTESAL